MTIATGQTITAADILALPINAGTILAGGTLQLSNGFGSLNVAGPPIGAASLSAPGVAANGVFLRIPAGLPILQMVLTETAGVSVSVTFGTSSGASDVMSAMTVPANDILAITALSLSIWAWKANQSLYLSAASWGGAILNWKVWYGL